jgi:hypothetical protein
VAALRTFVLGLLAALLLATAALAAPRPRHTRPDAVHALVVRFVHEAVQRRDPARAWELVTLAVRIRTTRADWNAGTMRVVPVLVPGPLLVETRTLERRPRTRLLLVSLHERGGLPGSAGRFLIRVVRPHARWLVSYWGPAMLVAPVLPLASTPPAN